MVTHYRCPYSHKQAICHTAKIGLELTDDAGNVTCQRCLPIMAKRDSDLKLKDVAKNLNGDVNNDDLLNLFIRARKVVENLRCLGDQFNDTINQVDRIALNAEAILRQRNILLFGPNIITDAEAKLRILRRDGSI